MAKPPHLGPVIMGTLLTRDLAACVEAYAQYLHASVQRQAKISDAQAAFWGTPHLAGCAYAMLINALGEPFLRIIEDPACPQIDRLKHTGWMALEIVVDDVDAIAASLDGSPFEVLRPVADLSLSDQIRAVQVRGPAGEILYLTQIKGEVPPFKLPIAKCAVDKVFIPVLCTTEREKTLAFYENLSGNSGLNFDTKITVINQAYGWDIGRNHPVATLQLKSDTLIEIDQVDAAKPSGSRPASGIMMVTFAVDALPNDGAAKDCPTGTKRSMILRGVAGEMIELVQNIS
ncbi:MAG: hypothetical protein L3J05_05700 [Robiginitomaculum sp.]|nr:hypothetical protein [Robiginitomaculum sp.]